RIPLLSGGGGCGRRLSGGSRRRVPAAWRGPVASAGRSAVGGQRCGSVVVPRGGRRGQRCSSTGRRGFRLPRSRVRRMRDRGCPSVVGPSKRGRGQSVNYRVHCGGGNLTAISFADG